jgi:hypothetical protein
MIIRINLAEERFASSVWEIPILVAYERHRVKRASFVTNHALWGQGGILRLTLLNRTNDQVQGFLTIEDDLPAFYSLPFELIGGTYLAPGDVLTLVKEPTKDRNLSLPFCLVQVELE